MKWKGCDMRLLKDAENIASEDKLQALAIMNKLKAGNRVFGNPAEGLKITLKNLERQLSSMEASRGKLEYMVNDGEIRDNIAKIKAGITGEEKLAEWFERVVKYDEGLEDIILFASLSDPDQNDGGDDYISDSDFVAIYGKHVLILDAKNVRTNPEIPIYLDGDNLVAAGGKLLLELHPSTFVWKNVFRKFNCEIETVKGCAVIVNETGACIWKNQDWHKSEVQPVHISDLVPYLHEWIKDKTPNTPLSLLATMSKMQIRKENTGNDLSSVRRRFKI